MLRDLSPQSIVKALGLLVLAVAVACFVLAPIIGEALFASLWGIEPLTYIGAALVAMGLDNTAARLRATTDDAERQRGKPE